MPEEKCCESMDDSLGDSSCDMEMNKNFNIKRSCLSEIKLFKQPNVPKVIGLRQATDEQLEESRKYQKITKKSISEYYNLFNKQRNFDFLTTVFAIAGLVLAIVNYEHNIYHDKAIINLKDFPKAMEHPRNTNSLTFICRFSISITTVFAMICLFLRQFYQVKWLNTYFREKG